MRVGDESRRWIDHIFRRISAVISATPAQLWSILLYRLTRDAAWQILPLEAYLQRGPYDILTGLRARRILLRNVLRDVLHGRCNVRLGWPFAPSLLWLGRRLLNATTPLSDFGVPSVPSVLRGGGFCRPRGSRQSHHDHTLRGAEVSIDALTGLLQRLALLQLLLQLFRCQLGQIVRANERRQILRRLSVRQVLCNRVLVVRHGRAVVASLSCPYSTPSPGLLRTLRKSRDKMRQRKRRSRTHRRRSWAYFMRVSYRSCDPDQRPDSRIANPAGRAPAWD